MRAMVILGGDFTIQMRNLSQSLGRGYQVPPIVFTPTTVGGAIRTLQDAAEKRQIIRVVVIHESMKADVVNDLLKNVPEDVAVVLIHSREMSAEEQKYWKDKGCREILRNPENEVFQKVVERVFINAG